MILSYETVKYVSIQDSRLGFLRYLLLLFILIYVGYIEMYAHGGYLYSDNVHGVLRFTVQQPTIQNCDPYNETSITSPTCDNDFRPRNELSYCDHYNESEQNISWYHGNSYPCEYYEAINAQIITETSVTIITRGKLLNQTFIVGIMIMTTIRVRGITMIMIHVHILTKRYYQLFRRHHQVPILRPILPERLYHSMLHKVRHLPY